MRSVQRRVGQLVAGLVAGLPLVAVTAPPVAATPPVTTSPATGNPVHAAALDDTGLRAPPRRRLAPAVWLAKRESYGPMSSHTFVDESGLRWSHDSGCADDRIDRTPSEARMAGRHARAYRHRGKQAWYNGCDHAGRLYRSDEWTPPRRGSVADENEGFFLNLADRRRDGGGIGSPTYVQRIGRHGRTLLYWFLYGWNDATKGANHEGDWERIAIRRGSEGRPRKVTFWRHTGPCYLPWHRVDKFRGHPVVFSAEGTHASYARGGKHEVVLDGLPDWTDHASRGARWKTWRNLDRVGLQAWWGYGGAWGEVGEYGATSGPGGPSPARANPTSGVFTDNPC